MAGRFSANEWKKIIKLLEQDPTRFGMPEGGREQSLVLGSFNIRKLSSRRERKEEIDFLARFCACCDLVSVQEVQDSLDGLRHLRDRTEVRVAGPGEYAITTSDITGKVPGMTGMAERLAFLYRHRRIRRLDMASDLTFDRTAVLANVFDHEKALIQARRDFEKEMKRFREKKRKSRPTYVPPNFVTFVRTPYVAAFEAPAANDQDPLQFTAVNAHLVFGSASEREQEFDALIKWLMFRLKAGGRLVAPNFILMGDLNLNFDKPRKDRERIDALIRTFNQEAFGNPNVRRIYFPFLDKHPVAGKVFRTNARDSQTFDQVGFFRGAKEKSLPNDKWKTLIRDGGPDGFDYGVFHFADLFAQALLNKPYARLTKAEKDKLGKKFEHSVSDHLPIWVRLPRPGFAPPPGP
jgi:endonuclease/exonuclease/phosphatase family metal-dependent hydrolase